MFFYRKEGGSIGSDNTSEKSELIPPEVSVSNYHDLLPNLVSKKIEKKVAINGKSDLVNLHM